MQIISNSLSNYQNKYYIKVTSVKFQINYKKVVWGCCFDRNSILSTWDQVGSGSSLSILKPVFIFISAGRTNIG
jgi:hypothetical protein